MDDEAIIERQLTALVRLVDFVFALVGLVPGGATVTSMPRIVRRQVLRMLRPAESALRRYIFIRAREHSIATVPQNRRQTQQIPKGLRTGDHIPAFALFDPRKWFPELAKSRRPLRGSGPRISSFDEPRPNVAPTPPAEVNPARLCKRLQAMKKALETLPAQAIRLAKLQARRRAAHQPLKRVMPLRPGLPPGYRKNRTNIVDEILYEFHLLALREPSPPERSKDTD